MRDEFGLTQKKFGELAGVTQGQVSRYEDPDYEGHKVGMIARLAGAVGWEFDPYIGPPRPHGEIIITATREYSRTSVSMYYPVASAGTFAGPWSCFEETAEEIVTELTCGGRNK